MEPLAAILIGSVWASHTLVTYPIVRRFGLAADPAVAVTVGATVITDTLSLLVLALVAGAATGDASGLSHRPAGGRARRTPRPVLRGLAEATRFFFRSIGTDRTYRFIFVLAACMGAPRSSDWVGIEGIVGAFFAGLALNRLVPNGSPLMERVEFFGSALFVPAFLVSVGLVIDPRSYPTADDRGRPGVHGRPRRRQVGRRSSPVSLRVLAGAGRDDVLAVPRRPPRRSRRRP
jgi:Kef-type K+ transport system membrane component KefB